MRVLADENMPREAVDRLRAEGHDVAWIAEVERGATDLAVLIRAASEKRVLVTSDKDFGELAFKTATVVAVNGVVLIRARRSDDITGLALATLAAHPNMGGLFVVAEPGRTPRVTKFA